MNVFEAIEMYNKGSSIRAIAKYFSTTPSKTRSVLKKAGVKFRDKSEAQKLNLKEKPHPRQGTKLSEKTKDLISGSVHEAWKNIDPEVREQIREQKREAWYEKDPEAIAEMHKKSHEKLLETTKTGSKFENFISETLIEAGHDVLLHKKGALINANLELDIYVRDLKLAIEIDGPVHYLPIFGEERLEKTRLSDADKNGLLISHGVYVLRIRCDYSKLSRHLKKTMKQKLLNHIEKVKNKTALKLEFIEELRNRNKI